MSEQLNRTAGEDQGITELLDPKNVDPRTIGNVPANRRKPFHLEPSEVVDLKKIQPLFERLTLGDDPMEMYSATPGDSLPDKAEKTFMRFLLSHGHTNAAAAIELRKAQSQREVAEARLKWNDLTVVDRKGEMGEKGKKIKIGDVPEMARQITDMYEINKTMAGWGLGKAACIARKI